MIDIKAHFDREKDRCYQAAVMFAIAAAEGAKRGLKEYQEENN